MGQVFRTQSLLTIILETALDISAASVVKILYQKPDGSRGEWAATKEGATKIKYDVGENDITTAGNWKFHSYAEIDGKKIYGEIVQREFLNPLINES